MPRALTTDGKGSFMVSCFHNGVPDGEGETQPMNDDERREDLSQLFGEQASNKLAPKPEPKAAEPDIAMLQDGIFLETKDPSLG